VVTNINNVEKVSPNIASGALLGLWRITDSRLGRTCPKYLYIVRRVTLYNINFLL